MKKFRYAAVIISALIIIGFGIASIKNERIKYRVMESIETLRDMDFKERQSKYPHMKAAMEDKELLLRELFLQNKLSYPPKEIFLRGFKDEKVLELWARDNGAGKFILVKKYDFERLSGVLGPKRKEGDLQVPEGFYYIDRFNATSKFYLALGLNYPNQSDRILGDKEKPGFDIFIHGGDSTVGCIPVGDEGIKEIYLLAVEAKTNGQEKIPVHIFPVRMDEEGLKVLMQRFNGDKELISFWENIKRGYEIFEKNHMPPEYSIDSSGKYIFKE